VFLNADQSSPVFMLFFDVGLTRLLGSMFHTTRHGSKRRSICCWGSRLAKRRRSHGQLFLTNTVWSNITTLRTHNLFSNCPLGTTWRDWTFAIFLCWQMCHVMMWFNVNVVNWNRFESFKMQCVRYAMHKVFWRMYQISKSTVKPLILVFRAMKLF